MTQPTAPELGDEEDLYFAGRERWSEFTRRVARDPMLDAAIFAEALQFALLKAANVVFSELAEVTARQVARREQEREHARQPRPPRTRKPRPRPAPASARAESETPASS
jgi:hypothetical protein